MEVLGGCMVAGGWTGCRGKCALVTDVEVEG